jgi:hypothetical protein
MTPRARYLVRERTLQPRARAKRGLVSCTSRIHLICLGREKALSPRKAIDSPHPYNIYLPPQDFHRREIGVRKATQYQLQGPCPDSAPAKPFATAPAHDNGVWVKHLGPLSLFFTSQGEPILPSAAVLPFTADIFATFSMLKQRSSFLISQPRNPRPRSPPPAQYHCPAHPLLHSKRAPSNIALPRILPRMTWSPS